MKIKLWFKQFLFALRANNLDNKLFANWADKNLKPFLVERLEWLASQRKIDFDDVRNAIIKYVKLWPAVPTSLIKKRLEHLSTSLKLEGITKCKITALVNKIVKYLKDTYNKYL